MALGLPHYCHYCTSLIRRRHTLTALINSDVNPDDQPPCAVGLRETVLVGDDHSFPGHPLIEEGLLFRG